MAGIAAALDAVPGDLAKESAIERARTVTKVARTLPPAPPDVIRTVARWK